MKEIIATLREINIFSISLRFVLAVIMGGLIGVERESKRRPAGFRTHILVCLGAALVMCTNQYMSDIYGSDPTRLGAQVISGIGFLGAGTIIVTRQQVKGLTTAASLWASACMGLAIGCGFYEAAIIAFVLIVVTNTQLYGIGKKIQARSTRMDFFVEFESASKLGNLIEQLRIMGYKVDNVEIIKAEERQSEHFSAIISLISSDTYSHDQTHAIIEEIEGIVRAEEL